MKFKFIYMIFFLGISLCLFTASKNGRAGSANWGNTGAPGDQTTTTGAARVCQSCHNSSAIQINQTFDMVDSEGVPFQNGAYIPGETYTITVTNNVTSGNAAAHGFQILALQGADGVDGPEASDWTPISANVQTATASNTGRTYAEHGSPSASNVFEMSWVAPAVGAGDITFYYVGAGVNLDDETGGDGGSTNTITLTEGTPSAIKDLSLNVDLSVYPNPVSSLLQLQTGNAEAGVYQLRIVDHLGKVYTNETITLATGENQREVNVSYLSSGNYTLQLLKDGKFASMQILKI